MSLSTTHPEDIKAALRKRYKSVASFERQHGLPPKSVSDLLRGRKSARVMEAVQSGISDSRKSELSDSNAQTPAAHSLNRRVK